MHIPLSFQMRSNSLHTNWIKNFKTKSLPILWNLYEPFPNQNIVNQCFQVVFFLLPINSHMPVYTYIITADPICRHISILYWKMYFSGYIPSFPQYPLLCLNVLETGIQIIGIHINKDSNSQIFFKVKLIMFNLKFPFVSDFNKGRHLVIKRISEDKLKSNN